MKKVIAIFLAAILIFSLAACGGTSGDTNSKTETSTSETKTGDTSIPKRWRTIFTTKSAAI